MTPHLRFKECPICSAQLDNICLTTDHRMPPATAGAYTMKLISVPDD